MRMRSWGTSSLVVEPPLTQGFGRPNGIGVTLLKTSALPRGRPSASCHRRTASWTAARNASGGPSVIGPELYERLLSLASRHSQTPEFQAAKGTSRGNQRQGNEESLPGRGSLGEECLELVKHVSTHLTTVGTAGPPVAENREPTQRREDKKIATSAETLQEFWSATESLLRPGSPFETQQEFVLGEPMQVFRSRNQNFLEVLESSALFGDREFLVFEDSLRVSFAEFRDRVLSTAETMRRDLNIRKGDRIAICAKNSPGWVITASAALTLGAVVVAMNSWWTPEDMQLALELTEPVAIVVDSKRRAILPDDERARTVIDSERFNQDLCAGSSTSLMATDKLPKVDEDDPALILFTSGTSGRPKAVVLTHRCLIGFLQLTMFIGARAAVQTGIRGGRCPSRPTRGLSTFPYFGIRVVSECLGFRPYDRVADWEVRG